MASTIILCPVDFSSTSDSALAFATSLAREQQKKLVILHVEGHPMPYGKRLYGSLPSPYERDRQRLDTLAPTSDVQFEKVLLVGDPVEEICSFAKQHPVDLIVVGRHGRSGFSRALLGSVAEGLVRIAPVPVLTVKLPSSDEEQASESSLPSDSEASKML